MTPTARSRRSLGSVSPDLRIMSMTSAADTQSSAARARRSSAKVRSDSEVLNRCGPFESFRQGSECRWSGRHSSTPRGGQDECRRLAQATSLCSAERELARLRGSASHRYLRVPRPSEPSGLHRCALSAPDVTAPPPARARLPPQLTAIPTPQIPAVAAIHARPPTTNPTSTATATIPAHGRPRLAGSSVPNRTLGGSSSPRTREPRGGERNHAKCQLSPSW